MTGDQDVAVRQGGRAARGPHGIASHDRGTAERPQRLTARRALAAADSGRGRQGCVASGTPTRPTPGSLSAGRFQVEAEREPEQVDLDPFLPPDQHAGEAEQRELDARCRSGASPTGAPPGRKSLPTAVGGRSRRSSGTGAPDEGRERVAVRSRPGAVARRVGVRAHRRLDAVDQGVHPVARARRPGDRAGCRTSSCPGPCGSPERPRAPRSTPQPMTSYRVNFGAPDRFTAIQVWTPRTPFHADGARGVDLDHRLGRRGGIGSLRRRNRAAPPASSGPARASRTPSAAGAGAGSDFDF